MVTRQGALQLSQAGSNNGKTLQYIEFQTAIVNLANFIKANHLSVRHAFTKLATSATLFKQLSDTAYEAAVDWPYHDSHRTLVFQCKFNYDQTVNSGQYVIRVRYHKTCFLELSSTSNNELIANIFYKNASKYWHDEDILELIDDLNDALNAKKLIIKHKNTLSSILDLYRIKNNHIGKDALDGLIQKYQTSAISYRINHVIVPYSTFQHNRYLMHLDWRDQSDQLHKLNVRFSKADFFYEPIAGNRGYSWVFSEQTMLSHFPEYSAHNIQVGQHYYGLSVCEVTKKDGSDRDDETSVLDIWLTNDGNYGELHGVHRGKKLSGNDVLDIYRFFDRLFQVKKTFFCDVSSLNNGDLSVRIPLRLILAIMTDKTWYQAKLPGVTLFECQDFPTIANGRITQSKASRDQALRELQSMTLRQWYLMLSEEGRSQLLDIYYENYREQVGHITRRTRLSTSAAANIMKTLGKLTLKDFTATVYQASKKSGNMSRSLIMLTKLLCGTTDADSQLIAVDQLAPDYWVRHRVNVLLNDSLFWVKEHEHSDSRLLLT